MNVTDKPVINVYVNDDSKVRRSTLSSGRRRSHARVSSHSALLTSTHQLTFIAWLTSSVPSVCRTSFPIIVLISLLLLLLANSKCVIKAATHTGEVVGN